MDPRKDLQLIDNDIDISSGDFIIAYSDQQHVQDTCAAYPGWWKANPLDGVAIQTYLGGPSTDQIIVRQTKVQLDSDGYNSRPVISRDNRDQITLYPNAELR